jgi:hypothetical protein
MQWITGCADAHHGDATTVEKSSAFLGVGSGCPFGAASMLLACTTVLGNLVVGILDGRRVFAVVPICGDSLATCSAWCFIDGCSASHSPFTLRDIRQLASVCET